jgi:hypothetical protein
LSFVSVDNLGPLRTSGVGYTGAVSLRGQRELRPVAKCGNVQLWVRANLRRNPAWMYWRLSDSRQLNLVNSKEMRVT